MSSARFITRPTARDALRGDPGASGQCPPAACGPPDTGSHPSLSAIATGTGPDTAAQYWPVASVAPWFDVTIHVGWGWTEIQFCFNMYSEFF